MMEWFENTFKNSVSYHVSIGVVIVAAFYFLSGTAKKLLGWIGKKVLAKTETVLDDLILNVVKKNVRSLMLLMGLHAGVTEVRKGITTADVTVQQILDCCDAILFVPTRGGRIHNVCTNNSFRRSRADGGELEIE